MKWINYMGHPILVKSLYLLLLIEGSHFGGFFLLYILMSLSVGDLYAIVAILGLLSVFVGYKIFRKNLHPIKPILYLIGYALMITALVIFFDRKERLETFDFAIPTLSFIMFGIVSFFYLIKAFSLLWKSIYFKHDSLKVII